MVVRKRQLPLALNHMTTPHLAYGDLFDLAARLGCVGVELRNDLERPLFCGDNPKTVGLAAEAVNLEIITLAELQRFNAWSSETFDAAKTLMQKAVDCGASAISLIPLNDGSGCGNGERQANLRLALRELRPMLEDHDLIGLIEPIGFATCSLRSKEEAVDAIEGLGAVGRVQLIHDTFHHVLAGEKAYFPAHTGLIHISGVADNDIDIIDLEDRHRGLVGPDDRLNNVGQIASLLSQGYRGAASFEAFSPVVHGLTDPYSALQDSIEFIDSHLAREAA